jgi:cyclophilin family peptidyl-prolyl cis-trans isomerase
MIQSGDPLSKDDAMQARWGTGGPGYQFADEIIPTSTLYKRGYKRGVVAMANAGPNTNGSQFFIMHADYPLPPNYTIFGTVVSGQEVVNAIATTPTGAQDRPVSPITITSVNVVDQP